MSGGVTEVPTYDLIAGARTNMSFKTHMLLNTGGSFSVSTERHGSERSNICITLCHKKQALEIHTN
jgi:hypothetical protein